MKGLLVVNSFMHGDKYSQLSDIIVDSFARCGIDMIVMGNAELIVTVGDKSNSYTDIEQGNKNSAVDTNASDMQLCNCYSGCGDSGSSVIDINAYDECKASGNIIKYADIGQCNEASIGNISGHEISFVLFWDKDILLARHFESKGYRVINSARAIALCDDKGAMAVHLAERNIAMPLTLVAPFTYDNIGYTNDKYIDYVTSKLTFPLVLKESKGSFGKQVYLVNNRAELLARCRSIMPRAMIFQQLISSSFGRDVRLYVVGGKVVAAMEREAAQGELVANLSSGGRILPYNPQQSYIDMAINACTCLGLDFGGVDILHGEGGEPILCEVNSNAHFKNLLDFNGVNMAEILAKYIIKLMN